MAGKNRKARTKDTLDMYKLGIGRLRNQPSPQNAIGYCHYKLHRGVSVVESSKVARLLRETVSLFGKVSG